MIVAEVFFSKGRKCRLISDCAYSAIQEPALLSLHRPSKPKPIRIIYPEGTGTSERLSTSQS
ncbi:hypothetical protein HMPREF1990_00039 [Porphyromonas gingivalis W4087]|nr:hypothetical protein HMPREF1990_00039 [Porphyromonas gingivalis W4087]